MRQNDINLEYSRSQFQNRIPAECKKRIDVIGLTSNWNGRLRSARYRSRSARKVRRFLYGDTLQSIPYRSRRRSASRRLTDFNCRGRCPRALRVQPRVTSFSMRTKRPQLASPIQLLQASGALLRYFEQPGRAGAAGLIPRDALPGTCGETDGVGNVPALEGAFDAAPDGGAFAVGRCGVDDEAEQCCRLPPVKRKVF